MIEIIYNETEKSGSPITVKPPKNIRQIGSPKGRYKIYVEDYVNTFLHSAVFEKDNQRRAAVLLGKSEVSQDIRYIFISGAVSCEEFVFQEEGILFDENCWEYVYKEIKKYFDEQEIVGWYLEHAGFPLELTGAMEMAHKKYFAGRDKLLFLSEPSEGEDIFFIYEQGSMQKKEGYYIYYEKNSAMQEYMIQAREKLKEKENGIQRPVVEFTEKERQDYPEVELPDKTEEKTAAEQAIQNYRAMFQQRKEISGQRKMGTLLYTSAAAAMVILCVIGITTMNNYEKMKQMEETMAVFAQFGQWEEEQNDNKTEVPVKNIPGEVTPKPQQPSEEEPGVQQPAGVGTNEQQPSEGEPSVQQPEESVNTPEPSGTSELPTTAQTYLEQGYYIVQPGDKLELICKMLYQNMDIMDKICEINGIENIDKIYIGQKLILP